MNGKELLNEFDESYERLQKCLSDKEYSEAATIQGYLLGMMRTAQILDDGGISFQRKFVEEMKNRAELLI